MLNLILVPLAILHIVFTSAGIDTLFVWLTSDLPRDENYYLSVVCAILSVLFGVFSLTVLFVMIDGKTSSATAFYGMVCTSILFVVACHVQHYINGSVSDRLLVPRVLADWTVMFFIMAGTVNFVMG